MTNRDLARPLDAVANQMQIVAGLTTELRYESPGYPFASRTKNYRTYLGEFRSVPLVLIPWSVRRDNT